MPILPHWECTVALFSFVRNWRTPTFVQSNSASFVLFTTFMLAIFCLVSIPIYAVVSPFEVPLESLKKIEPENVVQFQVANIERDAFGKKIISAQLEMKTRGGFKIYGHGLTFEFSQDSAPFPALLNMTALPKAETILDPNYNEKREVYKTGTLFKVTGKGLTEQGSIVVKFEACSLTNCLLPTRFLMELTENAVGRKVKIKPSSGSTLPGAEKSPPVFESGPVNFGGESEVKATTSEGKNSENLTPQNSDEKKNPNPESQIKKTTENTISTQSDSDLKISDRVSLWVQSALLNRSFLLFPALFVAGLLMNLTPCVYPMIPITLNVLSQFGAAGTDQARLRRRRILPFVYVGGMVLAYSSIGVLAGMTGTLFGSILQSAWVNAALALLMSIMGLSMIGYFDLSRIQNFGAKIPVGERFPVLGVLTLGAVSGLVSAPCTGPVLSTIFLLIGQTRDPLYGFILMTFYALGFGAPYVILGLFTQHLGRLPKAGPLVLGVKFGFAALMFALSFYYLKFFIGHSQYGSIIYERPSSMLVLIIILFSVIIFMVGQTQAKFKRIASFAVLALLSLLALWMTLWLTSGFVIANTASAVEQTSNKNQNESQNATAGSVADRLNARVLWLSDLNEAVQKAKELNRPVMIDAWAEWCTACRKMDETIWSDPKVIQILNEKFVPVKLDFTKPGPLMDQIVAKWDLSGLPAIGFFKAGADLFEAPQILFRAAIETPDFEKAIVELQK